MVCVGPDKDSVDVDDSVFDAVTDAGQQQLLRAFYLTDWANEEERQRAVGVVKLIGGLEFTWHYERATPPLDLRRNFARLHEVLGCDFARYVAEPTRVSDKGVDCVIVSGWIWARSKRPGEATRRSFEDTWIFEGRRPLRLASR